MISAISAIPIILTISTVLPLFPFFCLYSFFSGCHVAISTARAGNVIGGGDFANDRIIPDCVRAAIKKEEIVVRNPFSIRPYQHVLEPIYAYLMIAAEQYKNPEKKERL